MQNAEQGGNLSRSNASMSTGNLADLYNQPGLLGNGMQGGLRGVASTSNIWDGQVTVLLSHTVLCSPHVIVTQHHHITIGFSAAR